MNSLCKKFLCAFRRGVCRFKGHSYDFGNVAQRHFETLGITVFIMPCVRCGRKTVVAAKDSALRMTYPLELSFERRKADV